MTFLDFCCRFEISLKIAAVLIISSSINFELDFLGVVAYSDSLEVMMSSLSFAEFLPTFERVPLSVFVFGLDGHGEFDEPTDVFSDDLVVLTKLDEVSRVIGILFVVKSDIRTFGIPTLEKRVNQPMSLFSNDQ